MKSTLFHDHGRDQPNSRFQAFGLKREDGWFRLSAGAVSLQDIEEGLARVRVALRGAGF